MQHYRGDTESLTPRPFRRSMLHALGALPRSRGPRRPVCSPAPLPSVCTPRAPRPMSRPCPAPPAISSFPTSLPAVRHRRPRPGRVPLGRDARRDEAILVASLPLGPTGAGDSPYQSFSAFAGQHQPAQPRIAGTRRAGPSAFWAGKRVPGRRVDYARVTPFKVDAAARSLGRLPRRARRSRLQR